MFLFLCAIATIFRRKSFSNWLSFMLQTIFTILFFTYKTYQLLKCYQNNHKDSTLSTTQTDFLGKEYRKQFTEIFLGYLNEYKCKQSLS